MSRPSRRGPIAMQARTNFTDLFLRADQTPVTFPPYRGSSAGAINLQSNNLVQQAAFVGAVTPSTSADADITLNGTLSTGTSMDALARLTSARAEGTDSVLFTVAATSWSLVEFVAGTLTNLDSGTTSLPTTVRLVVHGTTAQAYINGGLVSTKTVSARAPGVWYHGLRTNSQVGTHFTSVAIVSNGLEAYP
jgi:hypothetical protein